MYLLCDEKRKNKLLLSEVGRSHSSVIPNNYFNNNIKCSLKTTENIQFRPYKSSNYIQFASLEFDDWSIFTRKKNSIYGQKKKTLQCKNQYILRSARNQKNKLFINYYDTFTCLSANWLNTNANKISYIILRY